MIFLYLIFNRINGFDGVQNRKSGTANVNTDSQWSKQKACFARATRVWLAVNHNTSVTAFEWIRCLRRITAVNQILCRSWGYERLQNSKDSLKAFFENVKIWTYELIRLNKVCSAIPW